MNRRGFSPADFAVGLLGLLTLASLLAIELREQRQLSRRSVCVDQLKQLGLGFHNYHDAFRQLPVGSGGTDVGSVDEPMIGNANRLSAFVGLLPFLEQQRLWEKIANPYRKSDGSTIPPMGPAPWVDSEAYPPWSERPAAFVCPSEKDAKEFPRAGSYVLNYGDGVVSVGAPITREMEPYIVDVASKRGLFVREKTLRFRDVLDGLSNTLFLSESRINGERVAKEVSGLAMNPSLTLEGGEAFWPKGRNACWADGSLRSTGFQTILPPNSKSATSELGELEGVMSASSYHAGGVHTLFADGAVQFVMASIDTGDAKLPSVATPTDENQYGIPGSPSPYGLWGALGTRASAEVIDRGNAAFTESPIEMDPAMEQEIAKRPVLNLTRKDGSQMKGRLLAIQNSTQAVIVGEGEEPKMVRLSELSSKDAYRLVVLDIDQQIEKLAGVKRDIEYALDLLEDKKFDEFTDECLSSNMDPNQKAAAKASLPLERGELIKILDRILYSIATGSSGAQWLDDMDAVVFPGPGRGGAFFLEDGRWKFGEPPRDQRMIPALLMR